MKSTDNLRRIFEESGESLSRDKKEAALAALDRIERESARAEAKYQLAIRERGAIHALLKKTSGDLISRYRTLFEYAGTAMAVIERDGTISLVNSVFANMTGYARDEIENRMNVREFIHESFREQVIGYHHRRRLGDPSVPSHYETRIVCRDGRIIDAALSVGLFPGTNQSIFAFSDITEQKRSRIELERHAEQVKAMLAIYQMVDSQPEQVAEATLETIMAISGSLAGVLVITGGSRGAVPLHLAMSKETPPGNNLDACEKAAATAFVIQSPVDTSYLVTSGSGDGTEILTVPLTEGGEVVAVGSFIGSRTSYSPIDMLNINVLLGGMWRVIQRRREAEALQKANRKLNLLSSITRHDVTNKLTALRGYLELALMETGTGTPAGAFIEKSLASADIANAIIQFTRYYQDVGVREPDWFDVRTEFSRAADQLPLSGIAITATLPEIRIFADPLIGTVFYNLIDNSLRHGGGVTALSLSAEEEAGTLVLTYSDNGAGVPSEDKTKIFSQGFGKHTGLGLFLIREILTITGISIVENGEPGKGARFEMRVPAGNYRLVPEISR